MLVQVDLVIESSIALCAAVLDMAMAIFEMAVDVARHDFPRTSFNGTAE
jgi:hypothetical protein